MENDTETNPTDSSGELAHLRDRTDEIELIISSLTMVVLFTLPGWMFDRFADAYLHLSGLLVMSGSMAVLLLGGLSYALGGCFLLHLLTRAYWVGLIGLRSIFPEGVDWERTPGIGPLTRAFYQHRLPDLQTAIERSDRLASSLFAVISVIALSIVWMLLLIIGTATIGGLIGAQFGSSNAGVLIATGTLIGAALSASALLWLCDAVLARRSRRLRESTMFGALVRGLARFNGWLFPQRLVLPVQLTLQSNTRPVFVATLFGLIVAVIVLIGQFNYERASNFTISDEFVYLDDTHLEGTAFRSSYYEDMRENRDRLRARPMIPSFEQHASHLRLFLPYNPLRDNPVLEDSCTGAMSQGGAACLRTLWRVALNGQPIDLARFMPGERLDLGLRGLVGVLPLSDLDPGLHVITATWNPDGETESAGRNRGTKEPGRVEHAIPFLFAPDYEAGTRPPAVLSASETRGENADEPSPATPEPGPPAEDPPDANR